MSTALIVISIIFTYALGLGVVHKLCLRKEGVNLFETEEPTYAIIALFWPAVLAVYIPLRLGSFLTEKTFKALDSKKIPKAYIHKE